MKTTFRKVYEDMLGKAIKPYQWDQLVSDFQDSGLIHTNDKDLQFYANLKICSPKARLSKEILENHKKLQKSFTKDHYYGDQIINIFKYELDNFNHKILYREFERYGEKFKKFDIYPKTLIMRVSLTACIAHSRNSGD